MRTRATKIDVEIRSGYQPGLVGRVGELHGRHYAVAWGAGAPFEILITRYFCDFIERYNPESDLVLSAHVKGQLVGSVSIIGHNHSPDGVQLGFFIVDPAYQGRGVGTALLVRALGWCGERGFRKVFLWTEDTSEKSRRIYEKVGFKVVEPCQDDRYLVPRDNLKMMLTLTPSGKAARSPRARAATS